MNRLFLVGNITSDIYYDHLLIKGAERSFLRLILMSSRPRVISGMRVVLWDEQADLFHPYLQRGSEIGVVGALQTREFKGKVVCEIEASNLILLRNINWQAGEAVRSGRGQPQVPVDANTLFVVGSISEDIYYDMFERADGGGTYPFLRLMLSSDHYLHGLRIIARGSLAQLAYPYLQPGSRIAVDGHLQTRSRETGRKVVEITAEHISFLENIAWQAGDAARRGLTAGE
jgi:single-stranded DNA-binding protein